MKTAITVRQIEAFRAILRHGTMTTAAQQLGTSQPSVSRLVAELERATKLRLFHRRGGRIAPTDEGLAFYNEVEQTFAGLDVLAQTAQDIRFFGSGRLRVGAIPAMALGLAPAVIARFRARYPSVTVSLQMQSEVGITRWVASRSCDVGLVANVIDAAGVDVVPLYRLPGVCALPAAHRLAARRSIRPEDLEGETFVSLALGDGARARTDAVFEARSVGRKMTLETPFGAVVCAMVGQGLGVGLVNPLVAAAYARDDVAFRPFRPDVMFHGSAIVRPDPAQAGLADAFVEVARDLLGETTSAARAE